MVFRAKVLALPILLLIITYSASSSATPIIVRKSIIRETTVGVDGSTSTDINVFIVLEGEGIVTVRDLTALVLSGNITVDPEASSIDLGGGRVTVTWENIDLARQNILKYRARGRSLFTAKIDIMINGGHVEPSCKEGYCIVYYEGARNITYSFTLTSITPELENQPLPIIVSWRVDPTYLYPVSFSEKPSSMSESGNEIVFSWSGSINNTYSLNVTFNIRGENPWGEVYLPSPSITISLDPRVQEKMTEEVLRIIKSRLDRSTGGLDRALENLSKLHDALLNLSSMLENQSKLLMEASKEASRGSRALGNAGIQLKRVYNRVSNLRAAARSLSNTSEFRLDEIERYVDQALANFSEIEQVLREAAPFLNTSADDLIASVKERLVEAKNLIGSARRQVKNMQSLINELDRSQDTIGSLVKTLNEAAESMADLSVMLREASVGFIELSKQMRKAAYYISVNANLFRNWESWMSYSEGFEWLNETFYSQKTEIYGSENYDSQLLGDMVEVSLPNIKVKKTPSNLKYITGASNERRVSGLNPLILALLLVPALAFTIHHLSAPKKGEEKKKRLLEKIALLEEKLGNASPYRMSGER